jgi:hypothetical protein
MKRALLFALGFLERFSNALRTVVVSPDRVTQQTVNLRALWWHGQETMPQRSICSGMCATHLRTALSCNLQRLGLA